MRVPWHARAPNVASALQAELAKKYPDLRLTIDGEIGHLCGSFPLVHEGVELDRFQIEIIIPPAFPKELPIVFETRGRVPHDVDWHTFRKGSLCVSVPEEWLLNPASTSLVAYLDGPLRNYLIGHALAEAGQTRPMGERAHGSHGLLEAYGDMVGTKDPRAIVRYLDMCAVKKVKRHWKCPCGSGRRVVDCHGPAVSTLRTKIPRWIAKKAIDRLNAALQSESHQRQAPSSATSNAGASRR